MNRSTHDKSSRRRAGTAALARLALAAALLCAAGLALAQLPEEGARLSALPPTPMGDSHLGDLASGATVHLRFPVPKALPPSYSLHLGNVVAFTGQGSSYRLTLRRDSAHGPVIYQGPTIANGDAWNAENAKPLDLAARLTAADAARGYIDIYASATVEGDGWTIYRSNPGRPIFVDVPTPESIAEAAQARAIAARGIAVLPQPQKMTLGKGEMQLTARSRLLLPAGATPEARFAARDLDEQITQRCGLKLPIVASRSATATPADIVLGYDASVKGGKEAYRLVVDARGARALGGGEAGLFYALQTLAQLVGPKGSVPHVTVDDWPAFPLRGIQYDVARGQTVNVTWWKRVIQMLARYKMNAIMIYGEDDYHFSAYPFLGRPGTFTPGKAKELSAYAHQYHLQLIPQFESLGHAAAVLSHPELKDLREAGGDWVFCTSNPKTWKFLDTIYGELAGQFPYSKYIHVGGDEFEGGFGKGPLCSAKVKKEGYAGLYAEHMNHLDALCRKYGRTMLFWPSHTGPSPEVSYLTIKAAKLLNHDCIPTEWIYHGPATYPEIEQYQKLGFKDVWASPAVVCFSRVWPDYTTTYRGIRGFLRAGAQRGIGGAMTTTWEWMYGGVVANSLLGLAYAAECSWSLGRTPVADFERRYGQSWQGMTPAYARRLVEPVLAFPWPDQGPAAAMRDPMLMRSILWEGLHTLRPKVALRNPSLDAAAGPIVQAADAALLRLDEMRQDATRNADLLRYTELAYRMYRLCGEKLAAMDAGTAAYDEATRKLAAGDGAGAATALVRAAQGIADLAPTLDRCVALYGDAVKQLGAWTGDLKALTAQRDEAAALAKQLRDLAGQCRAGKLKSLPAGASLGFMRGTMTRIGGWDPGAVTEKGVTLKFDVTGKLTKAGTVSVQWSYTRGADGLRITRTALLDKGKEVSADEHQGWSGAGSNANTYVLKVPAPKPGAKYEIVGQVASDGGTDSYGDVWLITTTD